MHYGIQNVYNFCVKTLYKCKSNGMSLQYVVKHNLILDGMLIY